MKRWKSVLTAFAALVISLLVGGYSLVTASVLQTDAASAPISKTSKASKTTYTSSSYTEAKAQLLAKDIILDTTSSIAMPGVTYQPASSTDSEVLMSAHMLANEWSKYTAESIKSSGLKKIYLVKKLSVNGQLRSGMPEAIYEDALYFDVDLDYLTSEDGEYMRRTFHHEYWHLIDYNVSGSYKPKDLAWTSCNVTSFKYGSGGSSMYNNADYAHTMNPVQGFINGYATSGIEEDRAEIYAFLMTNPAVLQQIANSDDYLACKLSLIRNYIKT